MIGNLVFKMKNITINKFLDELDSKKMIFLLKIIIGIAAILLCLIYIFYFINFYGGLSNKQETWGQFGDFIGGTVNPFLSFLSLLAIVFTVVLQARQLENSREELENSKKELEYTRYEMQRSAEAQCEMAKVAQEQAKYARVSARLAALHGSLEIISAMLKGPHIASNDELNRLKVKKEKLINDIIKITDEDFAIESQDK